MIQCFAAGHVSSHRDFSSFLECCPTLLTALTGAYTQSHVVVRLTLGKIGPKHLAKQLGSKR